MEITGAIQMDDLAELDRVCRRHGISRLDAAHEAVRYYIEREGNLPTIDYKDDLDLWPGKGLRPPVASGLLAWHLLELTRLL